MEKLNLKKLYNCLLAQIGPQNWWPADSKPEIILGAILVQNTNWNNVDKSLQNLKAKTGFVPLKILELSEVELESLIRPSGFYKNKSRAIRAVFEWFDAYDWNFEKINQNYGKNLRHQLLQLPGVGPETADVFLVYLFDQIEFIADSYARKLLGYLCNKTYKNYESLKREVGFLANFTSQEAQEFHGLIDEFGKRYLKKQPSPEIDYLKKRVSS